LIKPPQLAAAIINAQVNTTAQTLKPTKPALIDEFQCVLPIKTSKAKQNYNSQRETHQHDWLIPALC
jgi:hypothetical protein